MPNSIKYFVNIYEYDGDFLEETFMKKLLPTKAGVDYKFWVEMRTALD